MKGDAIEGEEAISTENLERVFAPLREQITDTINAQEQLLEDIKVRACVE